jgi:hypothetical protein
MATSLSRDGMFYPQRDGMFSPPIGREVLPKGSGMCRISSSIGFPRPPEILPCLVPSLSRPDWISFTATSTASPYLRSPSNCDSLMTPSVPSGAPTATTVRRHWSSDTTAVGDRPPPRPGRSAMRRAGSSTTTRAGVPAGSAWNCSRRSPRTGSRRRACSNAPSSGPESTGPDGRSARRPP